MRLMTTNMTDSSSRCPTGVPSAIELSRHRSETTGTSPGNHRAPTPDGCSGNENGTPLDVPEMTHRDATLSDCGTYRYCLRRGSRPLHTLADTDWLVVVGLNPSTADADRDDPTVRRCVSLARRLGKSGLCLVNVYALRSTDPSHLNKHPDPIGPENQRIVRKTLHATQVALAAWGRRADPQQTRWLTDLPTQWVCLGTNRDGSPKHPLYVAGNTTPVPWKFSTETGNLTAGRLTADPDTR